MAFDPITALMDVGGKLIDKLIPDPEAKAKAQLELAKMAQDGELAKIANDTEVFKSEQENVSARWTSDMASDSWLAKNIRPVTLVYILSAYIVLAFSDGLGLTIDQSYVTLLGNWGMLIFGAYFGGRSVEKIMGRK